MEKKMLTIIIAAVIVVAAVGIGVWALTQNHNGVKTYNLAETTGDEVGVDVFNSNTVFESDDKTFKWSFDKNKGDGVPDGIDAIDLSIKGSATIPEEAKTVIPEGAPAFFLSFDYDGTLPYEADLEYNLGKEFADKTMSFYEVKDGKLVGEQQVVKVDGNGVAKIRMTHCSDWTLIESFEVVVEECKGVTFSLEEKSTILFGEDITFTAEAQIGFDEDTLVVKADGKEIKPVDGKYTVSASKALKISADVKEKELPKYKVSGTVIDDDGKGVEGAIVYIGDLKDTTDKDGKYSISDVLQGTKLATMKATCDGYLITVETDLTSVDEDVVVDLVAVKNAAEYEIGYIMIGIPDGITVKINDKDPSSKIVSPDSSIILVISGASFTKSDIESTGTFSIGDQKYLLNVVISNGSDVKYEFGKEAKVTFTAKEKDTSIIVTVTKEGSPDLTEKYAYTPAKGDFITYNVKVTANNETHSGTLTMRVTSINPDAKEYTVITSISGDYENEEDGEEETYSYGQLFAPSVPYDSEYGTSVKEKIGGVDCNKYTSEVSGIKVTMWIGQNDGIVYKSIEEMNISEGGVSINTSVLMELESKNLPGLKKI